MTGFIDQDKNKASTEKPESGLDLETAHPEKAQEIQTYGVIELNDVSTDVAGGNRSTSILTGTSDKPDKPYGHASAPKSQKKGKKQTTAVSVRPKAAGPLAGIITLQEGETIAGGTLGTSFAFSKIVWQYFDVLSCFSLG